MNHTRRRYIGGLVAGAGVASISGCLGSLSNSSSSLTLRNNGDNTVSGIITIQSGGEVLESQAFRLDTAEYQTIYETTRKESYTVEVECDGSVAEVTWDAGRCSGGEIRITENEEVAVLYRC